MTQLKAMFIACELHAIVLAPFDVVGQLMIIATLAGKDTLDDCPLDSIVSL